MNNEFKEMQEELAKMKKEAEENKKPAKFNTEKHSKQQNTIRYRFYSTKRNIPWMLGGENLRPLPDIEDSYFNFVELPATKQFDFRTPFIAQITTDSDEYTYWKIERYTNNVKDRTYYFYTSKVVAFLKNAFRLELSLDTYLTYTRDVINSLKNKSSLIKVNRGTITTDMILNHTDPYQKALLKSLKNVDENVANGDDSYSRVRPFRIQGYKSATKPTNAWPLYCTDGVKDGKKFNIFNYDQYIYPNMFWPNVSGLGAVQIKKDDAVYTVKYAKKYAEPGGSNNVWALKDEDQKNISTEVLKHTAIDSIGSDSGVHTDWKEANKSLMNGYFAVFRNVEGTIDCYPLIGKLKARYRVPVIANEGTSTVPTPPASQNNQVIHNVVSGRFYCGYDTFIDGELNNDWESIYNDYVKNLPAWYTTKSYIGIYRGIIPTAEFDAGIHFEFKKIDGKKSFNLYNKSVQCKYAEPHRILLKLNYEDVLNIDLNNDTGTTIEPFKLAAPNTDLVENYVNLLQPICIGTTEIVPARYSFLGVKNFDNVEFTIKFLGSFLDGFYLFLKSDLYNSSIYGLTLGGTLPSKTEGYQQQLDIINQQKNAGVASAIGNIFARPINWITRGFGSSIGDSFSRGFGRLDETGQTNTIAAYGRVDQLSQVSRALETETSNSASSWSNNKSSAINIGGLGGFIGDAISIANTIKQSNIAKRNIGIGYLTSVSDDLLSAITHNSFILNYSEYTTLTPLSSGLYSVAYIKEFDKPTRDKYINYYNLYGFAIDDILNSSYINTVINYVKNKNKIGFFQLDSDWCLINLSELSNYNDNRVRAAIVSDLSNGIRFKKFN